MGHRLGCMLGGFIATCYTKRKHEGFTLATVYNQETGGLKKSYLLESAKMGNRGNINSQY